MREKETMFDNMWTLSIGAKAKCIHECGGGGGFLGKVLNVVTGGLIGGQNKVSEPKKVNAPMAVGTNDAATQAEAQERQKNRRGYQSTVGAGSTTGGGTTSTRSVLGG